MISKTFWACRVSGEQTIHQLQTTSGGQPPRPLCAPHERRAVVRIASDLAAITCPSCQTLQTTIATTKRSTRKGVV